MKKKENFKILMLLHILLMIYSLGGIFSKLASAQPVLSKEFIIYYGLVILILGIYAIGWQQVIKRMEITTAFCNKAVTIVWGMVWGILFFGEHISLGKVIGAALVMVGIVTFAISDEDRDRVKEEE